MLSFTQARNGEYVPLWKGRPLTSRFDPRREATRFVQESIPSTKEGIEAVLIIGDPLGYIGAAARALLPAAELSGITFHSGLSAPEGIYDRFWTPESGPFDRYVQLVLKEELLGRGGLAVLQWQPVIAAFPEIGSQVTATIRRKMRIINGSLSTERGFGKRWIRNSLKNYLYINRFAACGYTSGPVIIAASGKSLEKSASILQTTPAIVAALPSSLPFLRSVSRTPSVIVQTDPGYYADSHLKEAYHLTCPTASPLLSVSTLRFLQGPIIPLSYGDPLEEELFKLLEVPPLRVPAMGTVAATAMALALRLSTGPVLLAGLDLCYEDIHTHVRPHSFDPLLYRGAQRTSPFYSIKYRRSRDTAQSAGQSRALQTYQDWFSSLGPEPLSRVRRIAPSSVGLPVREVSLDDLPEPTAGEGELKLKELRAPGFRIRQVRLQKLLDRIRLSAQSDPGDPLVAELRRKLIPRTDPGTGHENTAAELSSAVEELIDWISAMEGP